MADENLHKGHRQRLKDRASAEGFETFDPHQVLELLLFYAIPRQDTSEIAHRLIDRFGSVRGTLIAPKEELVKVAGVGKRTAEWLEKVGNLMEAYASLDGEDRPNIGNYQDACRLCIEQGKKIVPPATYFIALTPSGAVQVFGKMCDSLQWGEAVALKRSLRDVLAVHARNVIVVEYTDAAKAQVGEYERKWTNAYAAVLRTMGAELLDTVVVSGEESISLNQSGDFDRRKFGEARSILSERYLMEGELPLEYEDDLPITDDGL